MATKPSASINLGLPILPEVDTVELYSALLPVYSAIRNVMSALDSYTGNSLVTRDDYSKVDSFQQLMVQKTAVIYVEAAVDLSAGHVVNIYNSPVIKARKAQSGSYRCDGYAVASGSAGDKIPVCLFGACSLISGMTVGADYYLSTTAGQITTSVTSQRIGKALTASLLWFTP